MATEERTQDDGLPAGSGEHKPEQGRWRRLMSNQWMVAIIGGLIVTVGGGLLVVFLTASHKGSPPLAKAIVPAGYYVNGGPGTPHYFLLVSKSHGDAISGTLGFLGQDGQTGLAQTFTGQISNGLISLTFSKASSQTATFNAQGNPSTVDLNACTAYLELTDSLTQCNFHHAANVQGGS